MTTIDQQITEQFGKIIKKFPILHHGWELDGSGGDEYVVQQFTELYDKNKKPNPLVELLNAAKNKKQTLNGKQHNVQKPTKGFNNTTSVRRSGRGG